MELIIELIGKILGAVFVGLCIFAARKLKEYIETKKKSIENADLLLLIDSFVEAAEQMFKLNDPTGEKRKTYVEEQLVSLGFAINSQIDAYIEAAVYGINNGKL